MQPTTTILLPTFNEESNIRLLIERIQKTLKKDYEILVMDDGSRDTTATIVHNIMKKNKHVSFYARTLERGIAPSLKEGFTYAKGDYLVWLDCNLKHPPEKIPELLATLQTHNIAKASRYVTGGKDLTPF